MLAILKNTICLPIDLLRLTHDAWKFLLEGYFNRFFNHSPEYLCPYCLDTDLDREPRMLWRVKYQNIWLIRLLVPKIRGETVQFVVPKLRGENVQYQKKAQRVPVWMEENPFFVVPWYTPFFVLILSALWIVGSLVVLEFAGMLPDSFQVTHYIVSLI
ncbi:MAG: hypothetical protein JJU29_07855 [Verrucomicrobia bacterium]|nr:hypothetical protein [Verrucomicrobiota bacterium]MCH8511960.1 hypothetical protein [Kiritimatiellia bacterium]